MSIENSSAKETYQLRVYYMRIHEAKDELHPKMNFNNNIIFTFDKGKQLDDRDPFSPFIYTCNLVFEMNDKKLNVLHQDKMKPIDKYHLEISQPVKFITIRHKDNMERSFNDYFKEKHYFIFNTHFDAQFPYTHPGLNTNIFTELCVFTYFILYDQISDIFDTLANQFRITQKNHTLDKNILQDFFDKSHRCLYNILTVYHNKPLALKIILRMIGLLSIEKINFDRYNQQSIEFTNRIMIYVRYHFSSKLYQLVNNEEWILFGRGLTILLSIELLQHKSNNSNENHIDLLQQIPDENQRQIIAYELLNQLNELDQPIFGNSYWIDLFTLIDPTKINVNQLNLTDSFESFIICITKISQVLPNNSDFEANIPEYLENRILNNFIQVDLNCILYLLKFLKEETSDNSPVTKHFLSTVQVAIRISGALKQKIKNYFDILNMTVENMNEIQLIICSISKFPIFEYIDKYEYLKKSLSNVYPSDYYIKWFQCFLANNQIRDETQEKHLLKLWIQSSTRDFDKFISILMGIDKMLDAFDTTIENDEFRSYFIDCIIDLCFQKKSIFSVIDNGLLFVQNELFRIRFKNRFDQEYQNYQRQDLFQKITTPLSELLEIYKQKQDQSCLVRDLIEVICDKFKVIKDNLIKDTFYQPKNSTLIYLVLLDESFINLQIRNKIIEQLNSIWNEWETNGFRIIDINRWKRLTDEKRRIACQIWDLIGKNLEKTIRLEELIDGAKENIQDIKKTIDNIISCLNNYCQNASDKNENLTKLQDLRKQVDHTPISVTKLPQEIELFKSSADLLAPIIPSRTWQKYLKQNIESKRKCIPNSNELQISCQTTLEQASEILDQFTACLTLLYTDQKQPLFPQLQQLFPDKQYIDHELSVLKPLFYSELALYFDTLLEYWKNHEHINYICTGYSNMLAHYQILISDKLFLIFQNIFHLDDKTTCETCIAAYQDYRNHCSIIYSPSILELMAQWSLSNQLFAYLCSFNANDIDDLLEVVNDWDETLINTKTVLDFISLKRFFDKVYINIESIRHEKSLEMNDVITCFEVVLSNIESKNILSSIESCSENLSSIKHIHQSQNKEQSKRRRILDIMNNSSFYFFDSQLKGTVYSSEYQFNVRVINDHRESTSFDELSNLRDRARLMQYASNNDHNSQLRLFISLVDTIEMILKSSTSLYEAGYPVVKQYYTSNNKFTCDQGNYHELDDFKSILKAQLADWDKQLCNMYKQCINLTYFSGQQISMVDDALHKQTVTITDDPTYHLLKFIGIDPELIERNLLPEKRDEPFDLLRTIAMVVKSEHDDIQNFSRQEESSKKKKIFLIETTSRGILRAIYSLFHLNNTSVVANQLFYCKNNTNWIEIRAFIYRCFYSQKLHLLIQPETLSIIIQDRFAQVLYQLIEQHPNHLFRLGIITTIHISHLYLINNSNIQHMIKIIHDQQMLSETHFQNIISKYINNNCTLVTSRIAGLGKSTYIRNEALRLGKQLIKFPISGVVNIEILTDRLRHGKIQSASSPVAIHIDIGPVQNVQQLNEFLYCLILFRSFRLSQMPVCVPVDIPIYIELNSSAYLSNVTDELVIVRSLPAKFIDRMDFEELQISSSSIQLVVNYLQAIDDKTINETDIQEETMSILDKPTCIRLLQIYFLPKKDPEFISWTQLSIFIAVYYKLFSSFSRCGHFIVERGDRTSLRLNILETLLSSSDQYTSWCAETIRRKQHSIPGSDGLISISEVIVGWDTVKPFILILTAEDYPLFVYKTRDDIPHSLTSTLLQYYRTIYRLTTDSKQVITKTSKQGFFSQLMKKPVGTNNPETIGSSIKSPEQRLDEFLIDPNRMTHEQFFLRLTLLSTKYFTHKSICLICFNQFDYVEQQCPKCLTEDSLIRPKSTNSQDIESFQKRIAEKLHSEYVFTHDNYIKMLLIYLRVQSNLPVLIMGETGCGKTALIRCLCEKLLDDEMEVFHIHAGVTNDKIIETMHEFINKAQKYLEKDSNKRLWVFFDEFNTTTNIGLLKEIVCERTLLGEPLPKNMVFLGACNPQRRKTDKQELQDKFCIKKYHLEHLTHGVDSALLYSVVPIPETMIEHIWDYGYLNQATEKNYIETMLNVCKQLTTNQIWFKCIVKSISESQKYFRKCEDVSSVSLRDVARFCRLYNWFYIHFPFPSGKEEMHINQIECASLLALFICYYFRLDSLLKRQDFISIIENSIKNSKPDISSDFLNKFLENEKMALMNRIKLPVGTAKNRALTDNIFVLFICIVNRLPVILCGQPGSSKTLAVQIIISNLKGEESEDPFFQTLPKLMAISYQGSQGCTSESIIKVFAQADKYVLANKYPNILPVIVFDEIGLAELSPHNPLKVLHSELEIETCRYGFVGLSNWHLDASKMNRAIYLSTPDPNLDDLKITAISLVKSMLSNNTQAVPLDNYVIDGLAFVYTEMCKHMKQHPNQHYFGLRDYYSLIKGIVYDMIHKQNQERDLYKIIQYHLSLNFDGIIDGLKFMWSKFCERMHEEHKIAEYSSPTFDQLIHQGLSSHTGRFLMLIGESENAFDYVQRYITIKYPSIQTRTLIGSSLAGDYLSNTTYSEQYNTRVLMDIILYAEKEITLFLRGLGHLYDNLYDLFNQNFAVPAKKKFCRIALGSLYHPRCVVNDSFYCVVFVKRQDLDKYDPPFINRFEKHLIDIETLIDKNYQTIVSKLIQWLNQCLSTKTNQNIAHSQYLSTWFNDYYILNLVIDTFNQVPLSDNDDEDILKYCQQQIIRNSSFDFPLLLSLEPTNDRTHIIQQYYEIHAELSFSSFINQILQQEKIPKLLIYTYTQIYHIIDYSVIKSVEEIKLSYFKTELDFIQKIKMHYQNEFSRLLCIRVDYHEDHQHLSMLKHLLFNEQVVDESHGVCLIFHLQRNKLQTENDVFFNGWSSVMIDNLEKHELLSQNTLFHPSYADLVTHLTSLDWEASFDELISGCTVKFRYTVTDKNLETKINAHRDQFIQQLILRSHEDDQSLRSLIKKHLLKMISTTHQNQFNDWRQDLLTNDKVIGSSYSFNDALKRTLLAFLEKNLSLLLTHLEKHSMIDSYLFLIHSDEKIRNKLQSLWSNCWTKIIETVDMSMMNQTYIEISLIFDLNLPCATTEYEIIRQIRQTIAQDHQYDDEENRIDFAYKQLISTSIYGSLINTIFADRDLFDHYYHDQLTLIRDEANIHQLSTSFVHQLLKLNRTARVKDQLIYLLTDYKKLLAIMQIFEVSIPFIGEENTVFEHLAQQFIVQSDTSADLFIETNLTNIVELLLSSTVINNIQDINQLITGYQLVAQSMSQLNKHYQINNCEKFNSLLHLASCISTLCPTDDALNMFKSIYSYNKDCISSDTLNKIDDFIKYLNEFIKTKKQVTVNDATINQTLLKFENELLKNWSVDNSNQYGIVLKFINEHDPDLWKYAAKTFTSININLKDSEKDACETINAYLCQIDDPTYKIEVLMSTHKYMRLILDENYQPRINENIGQLTERLTQGFNYFRDEFTNIEHIQHDQRLKRINSIAWLKYYLLCYVYALKNGVGNNIMQMIDDILAQNATPFCSTVKLYIIKQLCQSNNVTFHNLCDKYQSITIGWIHSMLVRASNKQRNIILPTPLFECHEQFVLINNQLSSHILHHDQLEGLIKECSQKQDRMYCFLMRFIHYYTRFYTNNLLTDESFVKMIENDVNKNLITTRFERIGYQFIHSLCTNFDENSYFHLKPYMSEEDLHQRLLVLNIIALLISFKSVKIASFLSFLFSGTNKKMPENYTEHFKAFDSLPGVSLAINPAFMQMINIQREINLHKNSIIDIIRCSSNCYWIYCLVNCEIPIDQIQCPLCKKEINVSRNDDKIIIKRPHIRIDINEISQFISQYIELIQKQKENHFNQPLTYHFINLFTNAIFLFLNEFNYMPSSNSAICAYFQESIATNYLTIRQHLSNVDQCYIWLYKLINHMMNEDFVIEGCLDSAEKVIQLQKFIEDKLINPHIDSVIGEIREYKLFYANLMCGNKKNEEIVNYVDELVEDNEKYPLLHFFNVINIHSIDIIDSFHRQLQLLPDNKTRYPLTIFLLERLSDYDNIPYLYPIIRFTNYLMQQFNHRISRNDAKTRTIADLMKDNPDLETIYQQFVNVWYKISLNAVNLDQRNQEFSNSELKKFLRGNKISISMFLLHESNDSESMIPIACLQTLGHLQNDIVDYYHSHVLNSKDEKYHCRVIPIQSIEQKHLFDCGRDKMRKFIVENGMMINYKYGMSKEIIYNYDEIEWMLRKEISCLPWIGMKNIRYFNYSFELYHENISLMKNIRDHFKQNLFDDQKRIEIKQYIDRFNSDSILQVSGSLEYILTYLCNVNHEEMKENSTIRTFTEKYQNSKIYINSEFKEGLLSSINLEFIIDLYELIQECVFDKNLDATIRNEFREQSFTNQQDRTSIINQFINLILYNEILADCLKDLNCWINMFKRLLVRILLSNVDINIESPLRDYVQRSDMWKGNVTEENIKTIEIDNNVRLKHAFIILKGLEAERNRNSMNDSLIELQLPTNNPVPRPIQTVSRTYLRQVTSQP